MPSLLTPSFWCQDSRSFVLVEDSLQHNGRLLLFALINDMVDRMDEIHFLGSEVHADEVRDVIGSEASSKLIIHDYWTNPLGWNVSVDDTLRLDTHEDLLSRIRSSSRTSKPSKIVVAVDAISSFLPYQTDSISCTSLWSLLNAESVPEIQSICVLGLLHSDLHSQTTINALRYLANIQIRLLPGRPTSSPSVDHVNGGLEIIVNKKSGKVKRQREVYTVDDRLIVHSVLYDSHLAGTPYEEVKPDPTANLTFNLSLKDSERKAKENVVLPYTSRLQETPGGAQSQIFYEPDEADDFDEEDPDDDLDI